MNSSLIPSRQGHTSWVIILVLAGIASSLTISCIAPFAALGVALAGTVRLRVGLRAMTAIWLSNQCVGFVFFNFARTCNTALWGIAIGGAALLSTSVAASSLRRAAAFPAAARLGLSFLLAYATYETSLFITSVFLGGMETFSAAVIVQMGLINLTSLIILVGLNELMSGLCGRWLGATPRLIEASA